MRLGSALLLAVVALPAVAQERLFEPTGEIRFHAAGGMGAGASFDSDRVVGPDVNLTRREDGSWAGDVAGHDVSLSAHDMRLTGPNVNLVFKQKGGKTEVEGLFYNQRIRVSLDAKKLTARYGGCSFDLARRGNSYRGDVGCLRAGQRVPNTGKGAVELMGEAASGAPPIPQLGLALLAILPS